MIWKLRMGQKLGNYDKVFLVTDSNKYYKVLDFNIEVGTEKFSKTRHKPFSKIIRRLPNYKITLKTNDAKGLFEEFSRHTRINICGFLSCKYYIDIKGCTVF